MSDNGKMDTSSEETAGVQSSTSTERIFWDAFAYIYGLVSRVWSSGDDSTANSASEIEIIPTQDVSDASDITDKTNAENARFADTDDTDTCKSVFKEIKSKVNIEFGKEEYLINISIGNQNDNDNKLLKLHLPKTLELFSQEGIVGLVALSNNEKIYVPDFNTDNETKISMTQYYRVAGPDNNCIIIHLTATTMLTTTDNLLKKLRCERYICVDYDGSNNIIIPDENLNQNIFKNWSNLNTPKYNGVVPDPTQRSTKAAYRYLFTSTKYQNDVNNCILENRQCRQPTAVTQPIIPASVRSPAQAMIKGIGITSTMYDMMEHGVNGLGEAAEKRYGDDNTDLNSLNTDETIQSIYEQIKPQLDSKNINHDELKSLIKTTCAINDFTDIAHDVKMLQHLDEYINLVFPINSKEYNNLKEKLNGLLTERKNIDVPKSHEIQKKNIKELETYLREKAKIIIPNIPTEKYESRYEMYVQLIVDLMQGVERSNYSESGKQITIRTFKDFYTKLDKDNQILFCQDVQNRINDLNNRDVSSDKNASAGSGKSTSAATDEEKITSVLNKYSTMPNYPSIPKDCGLDGCETGETYNGDIGCDYTIQNIYGVYDFKINGSNKTTWNITITRNGDKTNTKLLTWNNIPGNFHIILDDVIWYVNNKIEGKTIGTEEIPYRSSKYVESKHESQYEKIVLNTTNVHEKTLLVFSLKTAMDKLYRISGAKLTEIGTIDSYVWGDVYIQYLLGYIKNLLMIYRVSDATSDVVQGVGDCVVETDALGGRGLVVYPMVKNVYTNDEVILLMKKTLVYANWIQKLNEMTSVPLPSAPASPGSQGYGARSEFVPGLLTDVFNLKELRLSSGQIFNDTQSTLASLIPVDIHMSNRLLNFVERLGLNSEIKFNSGDEYEKTMVNLFNIEREEVIKRVNKYIPKLRAIIHMKLTTTNKSNIRKAIVELPDLEDLLCMSSPSFYIGNEDTLIDMKQSYLDKNFNINHIASSIRLDLGFSVSNKQNLFSGVEFLDNGNINITYDTSNTLMTTMVNEQADTAYKRISNNPQVITGPITLELLYKLKRYAPGSEISDKINEKINEIIEAFKSTFLGVQPDADTAYSSSDDKEMGATSYVSIAETDAYARGYNDGSNGESPAKSGNTSKDIVDSYNKGYNYGAKKRAQTILQNKEAVSDAAAIAMSKYMAGKAVAEAAAATEMQRQQSAEMAVRETQRQQDASRGKNIGTKRGARGGSCKRKRTKMPRRTIRRRAPRRGQKRTIRRQRRNKKSTQKRRK